jgi:hypothetical protein
MTSFSEVKMTMNKVNMAFLALIEIRSFLTTLNHSLVVKTIGCVYIDFRKIGDRRREVYVPLKWGNYPIA